MGKFADDKLISVSIENNDGFLAWGYINGNGQMVNEPRFELAERFNEDLGAVVIDGEVSVIGNKGDIVFNTPYKRWDGYVGHFSNGLAAVKASESSKVGFIDKRGDLVIQPRFGGFHRNYQGYYRAQTD